jgi:predicted CXXCH cytochrome family protein
MKEIWLRRKVWVVLLMFTLLCFAWAAVAAWSAGQEGYEISPHNAFDESQNPNACATCHSPHTSQGQVLIRGNNLADTCINCHNGTNLSAPMFSGNFAETNLSHSFGGDSRLTCNGCHQMHPPYTYQPLLRRAYTGEMLTRNREITGNTSDYRLCLDCHRAGGYVGAANINRYYTGGTGHYIRSAGGLFPNDEELPMGWQLSCSNCHDTHGSQNAVLLRNEFHAYPERPSSSGSMRSFCTTCHDSGNYLYALSLALPKTIGEHDVGSESCENCHGYIHGQDQQNIAMKAVHAPLVPLPAIAGRVTVTEAVYDSVYALLEVNIHYDGSHLTPQRNVPFIGKHLQFQISNGDGFFVSREETENGPLYYQLPSPQQQMTVEHTDEVTLEILGYAYIRLYAPSDTGVRVTSGGVSREFLITP